MPPRISRSPARGGEADGCHRLAYFYATGERGVTKDLGRALPLFQKSCAAGIAAGCNLLGIAYIQGEGVARDRQRGAEYMAKACTAGDQSVCTAIQACKDGNAEACEVMGL